MKNDNNANILNDLLYAQTMGQSLNTPDFLDWIADRMVNVYGENPNIDFIHSLRERASIGRECLVKAMKAELI